MAGRYFDNVVHEVLAEAARSLLVEHDRLLEVLGRSSGEECGDSPWLSKQFVDDTEEDNLVNGQDRNQKEYWHNEEKASDGTSSPHTSGQAASTQIEAIKHRFCSPPEEKDRLQDSCDEADGFFQDGRDAEDCASLPRFSVVSFGGADFKSFGNSEAEDCDATSDVVTDGGEVDTCVQIRRRSLCLSRGMTVQEIIEVGGEGRQLEQDSSFWHRLNHDRAFQNSIIETFIATVVVVNIAMIGISCDYGVGWVGWTIMDVIFAVIFTTECVLKLYFLGWREYCAGRDHFWNIFEALLALFAAFEVALALMSTSTDTRLSMLRVVRLARLARVIRICRLEAFSDLMMMINGAVGGAKTLLWSIVLISLPLYAVALLLRETLGASHHAWLLEQSSEEVAASSSSVNASASASAAALAAFGSTTTSTSAASAGGGAAWHAAAAAPIEEDIDAAADLRAAQVAAEAFSSLPWAFFNVFRCIVGQDCSSKDGKPLFVHVARAYGWWYGVIYCVTMLLMTFGLFNVIVAIYVENTVAAAKCNSIIMKQHRLNNSQLVAEKLHELMEIISDIYEDKQLAGTRGMGSRKSGNVFGGQSENGGPQTRESVELLEESFEITPKFMDILKDEPRVLEIFRALDIDDADIRDLFDTLDVDGSGTIDVQEMIDGLMKLRGDASRSDVVGVKLVCREIQAQLVEMKERFRVLVSVQQEQVEQLAAMTAFVNGGAPVATSGRRRSSMKSRRKSEGS